ncbi:sulfurtransferase [Glaciimonas immobilis]|uniref:Sulfurtransferase n=1 Tax=Glaciimonas immobilis TaxID=728004 RepID=A0A840RV58_9BURK|nr:sulfurtransferase [Glaciimonas immobilis]KAF3997373.1 sulfurtransferase [Glaciimonas immobilis]MBB5200968.1 thiosulfate/3-mercaptopyruvate sulfurtransferase [Glaciimonas immobilis]
MPNKHPYTTLISAANLLPNAQLENWVIIDCRHDLSAPEAGRAAYDAGHIPGARFAHLDHDLSGTKQAAAGGFKGRHPLPEQDALIATLRHLGINDDTQVVAYDAHGGMYAARLWWLLRSIGHASIAVLDGGLAAWEALGQTLSTEAPTSAEGNICAKPTLVASVDADDVLKNLTNPQRTLVDARAPDRFRGENETIDPVGGHIPGAKNRFFKDNLQADGRFKPGHQLHEEFSNIISASQTAVMQCGSGVTACHNLLALEIAGLHGAALYPGSWSEWCADAGRPVATGA